MLMQWNAKHKTLVFVMAKTTQLNGSVKEPNMFHNYETEKITCKASDVAENLQL